MRVAQLTDLHLVESPRGRVWGVRVHAAVAHALEAAKALAPDYYVLSGDLTNDGKAGSYRALADLLDEARERTLFLPGNHDSPARLRSLLGASLGAPDRVGFSLEAGGWHLLGVDTKVKGRIRGTIGKEQLAWLARELASSTEPAILFLHHPPIRLGTPWLDPSRLTDADALADVSRAHPRLRVIACGHAHMNARGRLGNADVFVTPSPTFQFVQGSLLPRAVGTDGTGAGFRLFELGATCRTDVVLVGNRARA